MSVVLKMMCVLLCAVFVSAEVMPMTDFDLEKVGGKWYLVGFATNAKWFATRKASMKMGTSMLTPTMDGDLDLNSASLKDDGSCWRMNFLAKKTETPGHFVFYSQRWGNDNDMRVVETKYDEYAIIHTIKTKGGVSDVLNKLYSRTATIAEDLVEKFRKFSLDTGILEENIVMLPPNGECSLA
ncbi:lipocalin-like isoform X1 [Triplophysa rosa]|uniref:Lipocalin-type prostaglandin D synthase-like protein n=1 Tax=Triplophysa rosa TaxID=992332 RepID=A0A9W7TA47_TRIRA|nr:lipocalin-like isoform X1 [Triplophysa rosa]KAI7792801.1 lipocalin-type prostaglandin D synthase-like protein [Triplophysa rosa]